MPQASIHIQTDSELKARAQSILAEQGLDMSTAVNLFLNQIICRQAMPFEFPAGRLPSDITLASEKALAKAWLLPEEDEAWADL